MPENQNVEDVLDDLIAPDEEATEDESPEDAPPALSIEDVVRQRLAEERERYAPDATNAPTPNPDYELDDFDWADPKGYVEKQVQRRVEQALRNQPDPTRILAAYEARQESIRFLDEMDIEPEDRKMIADAVRQMPIDSDPDQVRMSVETLAKAKAYDRMMAQPKAKPSVAGATVNRTNAPPASSSAAKAELSRYPRYQVEELSDQFFDLKGRRPTANELVAIFKESK
jgi:hypothetical protein